MIFDHNFYHADPHPGNLLVMDGCRIGLLDCGMVGRIDEQLHENVSELLVALSNLDAEHMTSLILRLGKTPSDLDRSALTSMWPTSSPTMRPNRWIGSILAAS